MNNNLVENAIQTTCFGSQKLSLAGGHESAVNIGYYYTVF